MLPSAGGEKFHSISRPGMESTEQRCVIAIDGPAASGKSSVARELARRVGFGYVNSGAMYRAVTWSVLNRGISAGEKEAIAEFIESATLGGEFIDGEFHLLIDDVDLTPHLHEAGVNAEVSRISTVPEVRKRLVERMRASAVDHDLIIEGRDIGSVVFPTTPYKFYIDASPEVRAQRRAAQGHRDEIAQRDRADSSRAASPLVVAKDAEVIDTSTMSIREVVDEILARLKRQGFAGA